ncbi:hypothetical protein [Sphingobacterium sp. MYb388]|uniref:hypothetical protein n=1 Tax=Sphingobacterium sp. MYb388 TaxID=2745437 RepID=UPI00309A1B6C
MEIQTEELLQAVIKTLKKRGKVLPDDLLVHGSLLFNLNGYHITQKDLIIALKDYIENGHFQYTDHNNIHITQYGIEMLKLNS